MVKKIIIIIIGQNSKNRVVYDYYDSNNVTTDVDEGANPVGVVMGGGRIENTEESVLKTGVSR